MIYILCRALSVVLSIIIVLGLCISLCMPNAAESETLSQNLTKQEHLHKQRNHKNETQQQQQHEKLFIFLLLVVRDPNGSLHLFRCIEYMKPYIYYLQFRYVWCLPFHRVVGFVLLGEKRYHDGSVDARVSMTSGSTLG